MDHERCQIVLEMAHAGAETGAELTEAEAHASGCDACRAYAACLEETALDFEAEYDAADIERLRSSMVRRLRWELLWPVMWGALAGIGLGASIWLVTASETTWYGLIAVWIFAGFLYGQFDDLRGARRKIAEAANAEDFLEHYWRNQGLRYVMRFLKAIGFGVLGLIVAALAPFAADPLFTGGIAALLLVLAGYNAVVFLAPFIGRRRA